MGKYYLLIATFLVGCPPLPADTLPNFPAFSLTVDEPGSGGGCITTLSAMGADFSVQGFEGNVCATPWLADVGFPFDAALAFQPGNMLSNNGGFVTLNGFTYSVALINTVTLASFIPVTPNIPSPTVSLDTTTLSIPATATGTLEVGCFPASVLPSCGAEFNPVANLTFNLTGVITVELSPFFRSPVENTDRIGDISFVGVSTPEPASVSLFAWGAIFVAIFALQLPGWYSRSAWPRSCDR